MKKLMFALILFLPVRVWGACSGSSPRWTAPTWSDVAACHRAASDGDTITVTPGSYSTSSKTTITKYVVITAAGKVTVTDNTAKLTDLIEIVESTSGNTMLENINFVQGMGIHTNPNGVILLTYRSGGKAIRLHNLSYEGGTSGDFIISHTNRGVIWDSSMTARVYGPNCLNNAAFLRHKPSGLTDVWRSPPFYGMEDADGARSLYVEHNELLDVFEGIDVDANARTVIRYNTISNSGIVNHGADTGDIAGRIIEIYNNTFVWDTRVKCPPDLPPGVNSFIYLRGGPALIHDNVIPNLLSQAWGNKSEIGFTVEAIHRNAGSYGCWKGGYPMVMQVGWGYSTGKTRAGNTRVFQDLEPVYLWGNTGGGNYGAPSIADYPDECRSSESSASYIKENREYYLNTARPGYTPFTYPHPLTTRSSASPAPNR